MKAVTKSARINSAIQVIQRMSDGMTVVAACDEVGIPRSTYYHTLKKNPEVMAQYQEMVVTNAKIQLGLILLNKTQIVEKVIADAFSDETSPKDRLTILKTLHELETKLTHALPETSEHEAAAREFLRQGVERRPGISRLAATPKNLDIAIDD